jgi:hypothetical protein
VLYVDFSFNIFRFEAKCKPDLGLDMAAAVYVAMAKIETKTKIFVFILSGF